jgi:predicted RNA-binding Zn ribbon-like protein
MDQFNTHAGNLRFIGGRVCLDYANTVDCHTCAQPKEYLVDYSALVGWWQHAGLLAPQAAGQLLATAARRPAEAAAVLARARQLRDALYALFASRFTDRADQAETADQIEILKRALEETSGRVGIAQTRWGYAWSWDADSCRLDQPLVPIAWSAAELLTSAEAALVRECEGEQCSWLFLDTSRNHGRRWCSMIDCGNRAKAQRHYARRRASPLAKL